MAQRCVTVLVSSAGRRVALLEAFREDAAQLGLSVRMLAADMAPELSAACHVADAAFAVPGARDPGFIPEMRKIAEREGVDLIVPTIDTELPALAAARDAFAAAGTRVAVSAPDVVAVARDKHRTHLVLSAAGIATPETCLPDEVTPVAPAFPRIVKPRGGSSSVGLRLADDPAAFSNLTLGPDDIVQHRVDGPEFTVNIFVDAQGRLGAAVPHLRIETRGGEVSKGRTARHPVFREIAERMVAALPGAAGALCFQARWPEGGLPQVFEINARFGGGYPLARAAGAPFSRWLLEEAAGLPATVADDWRDGTLMLRHDAAVFA